jgi:hypothetical protein
LIDVIRPLIERHHPANCCGAVSGSAQQRRDPTISTNLLASPALTSPLSSSPLKPCVAISMTARRPPPERELRLHTTLIECVTTDNSPCGQPWPPTLGDGWHLVCDLLGNRSLWRRITRDRGNASRRPLRTRRPAPSCSWR